MSAGVLAARYAGFEMLLKGIYINIYLTKGCTKGITLWKTDPNFEIFDSWQSGV
jgi:hypothetical protein